MATRDMDIPGGAVLQWSVGGGISKKLDPSLITMT